MTDEYVWYDSCPTYDSFTRVTWHVQKRSIYLEHRAEEAQRHTMTHVLIHICDTARLYVWHDWFICVIWLMSQRWLIHTCNMTHSSVLPEEAQRHTNTDTRTSSGRSIYVTWLIDTCDMTQELKKHRDIQIQTHAHTHLPRPREHIKK